MNVVALVDDIQQRVEATKFTVIGRHAHAPWGNAVARQSFEVVTVRLAPYALVMRRGAEGAGYLFPVNTQRVESRSTLAASNLRSLAPTHWDHPDCRP